MRDGLKCKKLPFARRTAHSEAEKGHFLPHSTHPGAEKWTRKRLWVQNTCALKGPITLNHGPNCSCHVTCDNGDQWIATWTIGGAIKCVPSETMGRALISIFIAHLHNKALISTPHETWWFQTHYSTRALCAYTFVYIWWHKIHEQIKHSLLVLYYTMNDSSS